MPTQIQTQIEGEHIDMNNSVQNREQRIRRALLKHDYRLWKVREGPEYRQYGPYGVIDNSTNIVTMYGVDLDHIESWLAD